MGSPKVIVAGWLEVDPEKRDEYVRRHEDLVQRARRAPGCIDLAISADPIRPGRVNNFEFWESEDDLNAWRSVANPPKEVTPILRVDMQKHVIHESGPPF